MKLYAPRYYKDFKCIADKCEHSCCVGWEIDIDDKTARLYSTLKDGYGKEIERSVDFAAETPCFKLLENDKCPHLDSRGLCRIITELGEGYLCEICREHPRFYNDTRIGKEVGVGLSCEEACRLVLGSDGYADMLEIGEIDGEQDELDFDVLPYRERLFSILNDRSVSYGERLIRVYAEGGLPYPLLSDERARDIISSLEYLDVSRMEMFLRYTSEPMISTSVEIQLERALAYFIYRHTAKACDEAELRAYLGFCLFCERLLASVTSDNEDITELARIVSEELEYSEDNTYTISEEFML